MIARTEHRQEGPHLVVVPASGWFVVDGHIVIMLNREDPSLKNPTMVQTEREWNDSSATLVIPSTPSTSPPGRPLPCVQSQLPAIPSQPPPPKHGEGS